MSAVQKSKRIKPDWLVVQWGITSCGFGVFWLHAAMAQGDFRNEELASEQEGPGFQSRWAALCEAFACSPCACIGLLQVLWYQACMLGEMKTVLLLFSARGMSLSLP
ncbi:hypothetical protein XENORESO_000012 [Xenotaenia resolanae]|uniref:Uncharacterized protein n=1 Tax=Xenotaenia resolanae TaxID=208358 RepID=A0ABV0VUU6_9TELE